MNLEAGRQSPTAAPGPTTPGVGARAETSGRHSSTTGAVLGRQQPAGRPGLLQLHR